MYTEDSVQFVFHEYCKLNGHPRCYSVEHNTLVVVVAEERETNAVITHFSR